MPAVFVDPPRFPHNVHYSHVGIVQGGRQVYVSGQVAYDHHGRVVGKGDLRAQALRVYENLKECLAVAGATFHHVVKVTTYVVDLTPEKADVVREVRAHYLAGMRPVSTMVGVTGLVNPELLIEVEVVAFVPEGH
ncbi:MAG: RidA family protein [Burkholderiales bacterium]|nr:RidA family protein [Burkholderiales bacterium]